MTTPALTIPLPLGIPTYGSGHERLVWRAGDPPVRSLFSEWTIYWAVSGGARFTLHDGTRLVADNGFVILPPSVAAVVEQTRERLILWRCHVAFRPCPRSLPEHLHDDLFGPGASAPLPLAISAAEAPGVLQAFRDLSRFAPAVSSASWRLERCVLALMGELAALARARARAHAPGRPLRPIIQEDDRLVRILRRIDADPAHPWSVAQLARSAGVSPHRLHGLCTAGHGISVKSYMVRARLELAMRMLRGSNDKRAATVIEVADRCGFSSAQYFNRVFRTAFKVTPRAFQRGAVLGERADEHALWGDPIAQAPTDDADGARAWVTTAGGFAARDGRLTSTGAVNILVLDRLIRSDAAIEFEGMIPRGAAPTDLSVFWIRDPGWRDAADGLDSRPDVHLLQFGAYGSYSAISLGRACLDYAAATPVPGVRHRVRAEILHDRVTLIVDGRTICDYTHTLPLTGGWFAIYTVFPGTILSGIRVFVRKTPPMLAATAIGDHYLERGLHAEAAEQYDQVAVAHAGSRLAHVSRYRMGLAHWLANRREAAESAWAEVQDTAWGEMVQLHRLDAWFESRNHERLLTDLRSLYETSRPDTRNRIIAAWSRYTHVVTEETKREVGSPLLSRYVDVHDQLFPGSGTADRTAAEALIVLGRYEEVIRRYPKQRVPGARALMYQGQDDHVLANYRDQRHECMEALTRMGRSALIERRYPTVGTFFNLHSRSLIMRGLAHVVLTAYPSNGRALIALGRAAEVASGSHPIPSMHALIMLKREDEIPSERSDDIHTLMARGQSEEALARYGRDFHWGMWPRHLIGLQRAMEGNLAVAEEMFAVPEGWEFRQQQFHRMHYLIVPFLRELAGNPGAYLRACAQVMRTRRYAYEQLPWHAAAYACGRIARGRFLAQPHGAYATADLLLCDAMGLEIAGDRRKAREAYAEYLEAERHTRGYEFDPVVETFAKWRVEQTGAGRATERA